ncbi:MAG TPA: efflux RND transporter permease subunit [Stellaceae bacterium]
MLSVPFALVGGIWLMWALSYNLDHALAEIREQRRVEGVALNRADLRRAIMTGAVERVRPKMMTVVAIMAGLLPILWSTGTGSEVMSRIAVPMVGGMVSSTILTLLVIPAIYAIVKGWRLPRRVEIPIPERARRALPAE